MRRFTELVIKLGTSTKTNDKLDALVEYFAAADSRDKVWVIALFTDRKPKRPVNSTLLSQWAVEQAGLPWWLFEESYHVVGDLAETISLLLPDLEEDDQKESGKPLHYYLEKLITLDKEDESVKKHFILQSWYWFGPSRC